MAMPKQEIAPPLALYQSPWWSRLAAISEISENDQVKTVEPKVQKPSLARLLSPIFEPIFNSRLITHVVKSN